ncbi:MAG: hypothetical protein H0V82_00010 [Candidatus Protochlamydia sp.]|nr:hypothetical protein [Candidatus Protochlamydia sp.]
MQLNHLNNIINNLLLNSLSILKDKDYQKNVWFKNLGTDESFPSETIDHFLDNAEKILNDESCTQQLGDQNFSLLKQLHGKIKSHIDSLEATIDIDCIEEDVFLDDPRWISIQAVSGELYLKLTKFVLRNTNEK